MSEELDSAVLRVQHVRVVIGTSSPARDEALLVYDVPHNTRFDVFHQGPGATEFTYLTEDVLLKRFTAKELAARTHGFKVVVSNSGGGSESAAAVAMK